MSPVTKKNVVTQKVQKPKTGAFVSSHTNRKRKSATATNVVVAPVEDVRGFEEYLVYKKLKAEIGEFYQYPSLWLETPHDLLGGRTPLEIALASPEGNEFILDMIQSIKAGYFS